MQLVSKKLAQISYRFRTLAAFDTTIKIQSRLKVRRMMDHFRRTNIHTNAPPAIVTFQRTTSERRDTQGVRHIAVAHFQRSAQRHPWARRPFCCNHCASSASGNSHEASSVILSSSRYLHSLRWWRFCLSAEHVRTFDFVQAAVPQLSPIGACLDDAPQTTPLRGILAEQPAPLSFFMQCTSLHRRAPHSASTPEELL